MNLKKKTIKIIINKLKIMETGTDDVFACTGKSN